MSEGYEDTYDIIQENGQDITLVFQKESEREYDKFGAEIKTIETDTETVKAFPIRINPSQKQLAQAGIDIKVSLLLYISQKELDLKSIIITEKRDKVRYNGSEYMIDAERKNGHNFDKFRSVVLGLNHA